MKDDLVKLLIAVILCPLLVIDFLFLFTDSRAWDLSSRVVMGTMIAVPLWGVKLGVIGLLVVLAAWGFTFKTEYAFQGAEDQARWRDVRVWAALVIACEIVPYLFF